MLRATTVLPLTPLRIKRVAAASSDSIRPHDRPRILPLSVRRDGVPSTAGGGLAWGLASPKIPGGTLQGLGLIGLLMGVLLLALPRAPVPWPAPDGPSLVACAAIPPPLARALGSGPFPLLRCLGASPVTVVAWHVLPSQDGVALAADDLEDNDDDLSALAGPTAQDVSPPPAPCS